MGYQDIIPLKAIADDEPRRILSVGMTSNGTPLTISQKARSTHTYILGLSGSGKTKFLQSLLLQDIITGTPFTLIDPKGSLYQETVETLAFISRYHSQGLLKDPTSFWDRYLLLDFTDPSFPLRFNPLEATAGETTEDLVGDLMRAVARELVGDMNQTRRLEQILSNAFWVIAENIREGHPLTLLDTDTFLLDEKAHKTFLSRLDTSIFQNIKVMQYWEAFFAGITSREKRLEKLESSLNILQYFWRSRHLKQFLGTSTSNFSFHDILSEKKSLLVSVPMAEGTRNVGQILGTLIATKLQRTAMRRNTPVEKAKRHYLYIDEFHYFVDQDFAEAMTVLREYGLSLVMAHQSMTQPPLNSPEGEGIVTTIKNNAFLKVIFRIGREDAEQVVHEVFRFTEKRIRREWDQVSIAQGKTLNTSRGTTKAQAFSQQDTRSHGQNWSQSEQESTTKTQEKSVAKSRSLATSEQESVTETESIGTTRTSGSSEANTQSHSSGGNQGASHGQSEGINPETGEPRSEGISQGATQSSNWNHGASTNQGHSESTGETLSHNTAHATTKGRTETIGRSVTKGTSLGKTIGTTKGTGENLSHGTTSGRSLTEGTNESLSQGTSQQVTRTRNVEFHSLEGEKEFAIQELQELPNRKAFIIQGGLVSEQITTHTIPPHHTTLNKPFIERLRTYTLTRFLSPIEEEQDEDTPQKSRIINL